MSQVSIILGVIHICLSIIFILFSIPLLKGKIKMNNIYGFRFKKCYESESNWYHINRYGGKQLIFWSIHLLLFGVVTLFLPLENRKDLAAIVSCAPLIVIIPAIQSYLYSKKF